MDNIYVYDRNTGFILYSIDNATPEKIEKLKRKGITFIIARRASLLNQYVVTANGQAIGFDTIQHQGIIQDKQGIFADGNDRVVFSGIAPGTSVSIDKQVVWTANSIDTSFAFSVNGYSTTNHTVRFQKYGYHKIQYRVATLPPPPLVTEMVSDPQ